MGNMGGVVVLAAEAAAGTVAVLVGESEGGGAVSWAESGEVGSGVGDGIDGLVAVVAVVAELPLLRVLPTLLAVVAPD